MVIAYWAVPFVCDPARGSSACKVRKRPPAPIVGAVSLALIGLFNIAGSFLSGWSGQVNSKKKARAGIYIARGIILWAFIALPLHPFGV